MRSCKALFLLGAVGLVISLGLLWGCGDDDNPTNWGNANDPRYQAVNEQFNNLVDSTITLFKDGLGSIVSLPGDGNVDPIHYGPGDPGATTDTLSISYDGGWHIVYLSWHAQNGYLAQFHDSVQFIKDGEPTQLSNGLEEMSLRHHWSLVAPDPEVSCINAEGHTGLDFEGLNTDEATINGTHEQVVEAQQVTEDSTVHFTYAVEATLSNFTVSKTGSGWAQGCPNSGYLAATITMTYQKDDGTPIESVWHFTAFFEGGTVTTTANSGGFTWSYTRDECTPPSN